MPESAETLDDLARAIWRETYRHDTLMEWHEIKRGTMHHKRVMAAAKAAFDLVSGSDAPRVILPGRANLPNLKSSHIHPATKARR